MLLLAVLAIASAAAPACGACGPEARAFLDAVSRAGAPVAHPEPAYHFADELYAAIAPWVAERPGVVEPLRLGQTAEGADIWGFRLREPGAPVRGRMLVFGNIHALEWVPSEVALTFLEGFAAQPIAGVEVVVVPTLNRDGRARVERDLLSGERVYRRGNAAGVDLNRDFGHNRESTAIWKALLPRRYVVSPRTLSQPESRAIVELAAAAPFDAAVSLHSFGGFFYYPWAGRFERAADHAELHRLGVLMQGAMDRHPYRPRQLSRWGFFFRGLGMEVDHLYGEWGTYSFLVETTRSGLRGPRDLSDPFRVYNPVDPRPHAREGLRYLRALAAEVATGRVKARGPR
jgi:hypothetical protein